MPQNLLAVLGQGLVDPATPIIRADDAGVTRGDGCFEGVRIRVDAEGRMGPAKLERHLARMGRSAAALELPFDPAPWRELVAQACAAWRDPGAGEAALKLVLTRGPAVGEPLGYLTISEVNPDYVRQRRDGIRVVTLGRGLSSAAFGTAPWLLGGVKTLSYAINMAAQREADRLGVEDVVFVSSDGRLLEAPTGSLVWAQGGALRTTPTGPTGILAGTTQQLLFDRAAAAGWDVGEQLITADDLHAADTVWVISSVRGPVDVVEIDGKTRGRDLEIIAAVREFCGF